MIHDPIYLEAPELTIPNFSFVWSRVDLPVDTPKVIDPIIRENMAEAANDLFNAMDDCVLEQKEILATGLANNCQNLDAMSQKKLH